MTEALVSRTQLSWGVLLGPSRYGPKRGDPPAGLASGDKMNTIRAAVFANRDDARAYAKRQKDMFPSAKAVKVRVTVDVIK